MNDNWVKANVEQIADQISETIGYIHKQIFILMNYKINNIDINIISQKPKISKLKNKMIQSISKICELSPNQINIKGKTTEKLGLIGKEKAIACEVITSVIKYA